MARGARQDFVAPTGLLRIEDCLDAEGNVEMPPDVTLSSLIDRNITFVGDAVAYRYLDYAGADDGRVVELTWAQLGVRMRAIGARLQQLVSRGDRVAILAPQGLDYVAAFYAAIRTGTVAVPLFAPELPGHAERLDTALRDSRPAVVLVTAAATEAVEAFLDTLPPELRPRLLVVDDIPDAAHVDFVPVEVDVDDVSHLQYTSGSTRPPVGVEITHRAVGTNLIQMILSIDLLDRNTHGVSWLPLYHDMGLSMIGFPAVYGGHSTLMSPTAFIRRPERWIRALSEGSSHGRVVTAAPNFAYEWTAQRGRPAPGADVDLSHVVLIIGSEPVSVEAITAFHEAFAPYGLPATAIKPSYGIAEATLFVATTAPTAAPAVTYFDRDELAAGRAVPVPADAPGAVAQVSSGQVARSLWAAVVDPDTGDELPDGRVGEMWLHGDNVGRGYWGQPEETARTFGATLRSRLTDGSHAAGPPIDGRWLRTGDLGVYLDGELYVTGRIVDRIEVDGRHVYPQDVEATTADASPAVRRGYVAAFTIPAPDGRDVGGERLVIIAERAARSHRGDPAAALAAIRTAVAERHALAVHDVRLLPAGAIPRTTSGKLARRACRAQYLAGQWD
ncbi:nitrate ABC transporter substrate-binding protein [Mycolicibacterium madagascariense]|uniref:Nitrate ABC transporter substrate-binding protein n=1 Tax=Mycolicibacterium madagascariense TaxID=212765 RepID=A0A7I7XHD3_9MYCO|nr:fatty acyl-AMP ligase [Mycolicibacterium madagascariense]MCV7011513.1 AMP-binding protein [Mycolicibacterium madagascariense]BBZ28616.1 nitrate ABC transporter substrate-binding protein [Mycolicibacterium madagascariense]